jgi:hydrophobic/amphiphilic exporter-1 (mainly G- bacteria), HAE1 family
MMTSFAFILRVLPLAIATGPGAEMRQALGTVVFSGMLGVTLFGLFLTPVFYVLLRRTSPARAASREDRPGSYIAPRLDWATASPGTAAMRNHFAASA